MEDLQNESAFIQAGTQGRVAFSQRKGGGGMIWFILFLFMLLVYPPLAVVILVIGLAYKLFVGGRK